MVVTGIYYAAALAVAGLLVAGFTKAAAGAPFFVLALFCLFFFRDPNRLIPDGPVAVAPADGRVVAVKALEDGRMRLSIFLSIFDVHVNRSPIGGEISAVRYHRGRFHIAALDKASAENEQNVVTVAGAGTAVEFKQIAGIVARRIIFTKKVGDRVERGERVGMIQFGSRADVILGPEWEITVQAGDRVRAGSSIVARRRDG